MSYKETFQLIKANKLWLGASIHSGDREFGVPKDYPLNAAGCREDERGNKFIRVKGVRWFTNLDFKERHEDLILYKPFSLEEYPKYDNYNAINVDKTSDIPMDYGGFMGVPITFMDKYNPGQFEILGICAGNSRLNKFYGIVPYTPHPEDRGGCAVLNNKRVYSRILIRRKQPTPVAYMSDYTVTMAAEGEADTGRPEGTILE